MLEYKQVINNSGWSNAIGKTGKMEGYLVDNMLQSSVRNIDEYFTGNRNFYNADGDDDTGEPDTEFATDEDLEGFEGEEKIKVRQLIREKKLALKAQYGKGKYVVTDKWRRGPEVGATVSFVTANIHPRKTKWVRGWRYQWKQLKKSGYKSQLRQMAKGMIPLVNQTTGATMTDVFATPQEWKNEIQATVSNPVNDSTGDSKSGEAKTMWQKPTTYIAGTVILAGVVGIVILGIKIFKN